MQAQQQSSVFKWCVTTTHLFINKNRKANGAMSMSKEGLLINICGCKLFNEAIQLLQLTHTDTKVQTADHNF